MKNNSDLTVFCMAPVPFRLDGAIDETALRNDLQRLVDARTGLFLASGGAGEAHVLTPEELHRVYKIGTDVGKGKVPVYAGLRESRSAAAMYEVAKAAVDAGVDAVQLYQLDNGHGMVPTLREQQAYWYELLDAIKHPVAISIHYDSKFKAPTPFLIDLVDKYPQIVVLNAVGSQVGYFLELRDALPKRVKMYCGAPEFVQFATIGASGYINPSNNIIPFTCRAIIDAFLASDVPALCANNVAVMRFLRVMNQWAPSTARWVKMAMKLNGTGNGVLRRPYVLPPDDEMQKMKAQLDAIGIEAIEAKAKAYVLSRG